MRIAKIGLLSLLLATGAPLPLTAQTAQPVAATATSTESQPRLGPETGFPMPRYVSLRAGEANARRGPSRTHRIDWVFTRRNMPMMIVAEHGHWRRVVDQDGAGGWMHYSLLSGERTAIVEVPMLPMYARPDPSSLLRATIEMGVTGALDECVPGWCQLEAGGFRGWVDSNALWGVDPGEIFD